MNCFLTSPGRYRKEYFEDGPRLQSKYLTFGKNVHELIENGKYKELLPDLIVYDTHELEIKCQIREVPVLAFIDNYDPVKNVFREVKTGTAPWDMARVIKHGQLLFYAAALQNMDRGRTPAYCDLDWIETKMGKREGPVDDFWRESETELNITGKLLTFHREFDHREIEKMEKLIRSTAEDISSAYKQFIKEI
jgi:hypothetical protein